MVDFIIIALVAQVSTHLTHGVALKKNWGTVRISSGLTLLFILLSQPFDFELKSVLQAAFLGASFVGMTDPKRLSSKQLAVASLLFVFIFRFSVFYFRGLGGALGFSAFVSCLLISFLSSFYLRIRSFKLSAKEHL